MRHIYKTKDTCATEIAFDIEEGKVWNVQFSGGCSGNLQAIPILVEGLTPKEIIDKLGGIRCGRRPTSCTGQLAAALQKYSGGKS